MTLVLYCILKPLSRRFVCTWFQDRLINSFYVMWSALTHKAEEKMVGIRLHVTTGTGKAGCTLGGTYGTMA